MNITINDDFLDEPAEFFNITLERPPDMDTRITIDRQDGVVQIEDNDGLSYIIHSIMYRKNNTLQIFF